MSGRLLRRYPVSGALVQSFYLSDEKGGPGDEGGEVRGAFES